MSILEDHWVCLCHTPNTCFVHKIMVRHSGRPNLASSGSIGAYHLLHILGGSPKSHVEVISLLVCRVGQPHT
jgi:hypothetical protein